MAVPNLTDQSESTDETKIDKSKRRETLIQGIIDNRWSWIIAAVSFVAAWWVARHIGRMEGTATFYIGLFLVIGLIALVSAIRNIQTRLKRLKYARSP